MFGGAFSGAYEHESRIRNRKKKNSRKARKQNEAGGSNGSAGGAAGAAAAMKGLSVKSDEEKHAEWAPHEGKVAVAAAGGIMAS